MNLRGGVIFFGLASAVFAGGDTDRALADSAELARTCMSRDADSGETAELSRVVRDCTNALAVPMADEEARSAILVHRGVAFRNLGDLESSLADLSEAVRLSSMNAEALRMLAWTQREMNRLDEAEANYDKALSIEWHWQGLLSRCVVRIDLGKFSRAIVDCEQA
jgi:tetratricopeptide (TPR) repeat protein